MRLYEVMAGVYFRSFQSSMVRSIQHADARRETARARAEDWKVLFMGDCVVICRKKVMWQKHYMHRWCVEMLRGHIAEQKEIAWAKEHLSGVYVKLKQNR